MTENKCLVNENLLDSEELADVIFLVGEELNRWRIPAHRVFFAKNSEVFKQMLYGSLKRNEQEPIVIEDVHPETFLKLKKYFYQGIIESNSIENALDLIRAAHKYMVPFVIETCATYLHSIVNPENALQIFDSIDVYLEDTPQLVQLHLKISQIVDELANYIIQGGGFLFAKKTTVDAITRRGTLKISSEENVLDAIFRWSITECQRKNMSITASNRMDCIKDMLTNVNYPALFDGGRKIFQINGLADQSDLELNFVSLNRERKHIENFLLGRWKGDYPRPQQICENRPSNHRLNFELNGDFILIAVKLFYPKYCSIFRIFDKTKILCSLRDFEISKINDFKSFLKLKQPIQLKRGKKYSFMMKMSVKFSLGSHPVNAEPVSKFTDNFKEWQVKWEEVESTTDFTNDTSLSKGQAFELVIYPPLV